MAETEAVKDAMWLYSFLNELGYQIKIPIIIVFDNQGAMKLAKNPVFHARTKHIDIRRNFIREQIKTGLIELNYVQTSDNLADIITKPLHGPKFNKLLDKLLIKSI